MDLRELLATREIPEGEENGGMCLVHFKCGKCGAQHDVPWRFEWARKPARSDGEPGGLFKSKASIGGIECPSCHATCGYMLNGVGMAVYASDEPPIAYGWT